MIGREVQIGGRAEGSGAACDALNALTVGVKCKGRGKGRGRGSNERGKGERKIMGRGLWSIRKFTLFTFEYQFGYVWYHSDP